LALAIQTPELAAAGLDQHKFHGLFAFGASGWWSIFAHSVFPYYPPTRERLKLLTVSNVFSSVKIPALGGRVRAGIVTRHRDWLWRRGSRMLTVIFDREISITEKLTGLDRETDRNLGATVEGLDRPTIDKSHRAAAKKEQVSARIDWRLNRTYLCHSDRNKGGFDANNLSGCGSSIHGFAGGRIRAD
jgi:hypothetical protein